MRELVARGLTVPDFASDDQPDWSADPVGYVRQVLKVEPWEKQQELLESLREHRRVAVRSCHHSGKTFCAAAAVHWFCRSFDPSLVITTAPTERQVKKLLWYEIAQHQHRGRLPGKLDTTALEVSATQRAYGFTTNAPEKFQGWHSPNVLVVVDEASGVGEDIYQAIEGILTSANARLLLIGNPNQAMGTFYEAFRSPLYQKLHISAFDVPERLLPPGWKEERRQEWGQESPAYQVRVLGNFPPQGENTLFNLNDVEAATDRDMPAGEPCEMGVDVAYYGDDSSVAVVRKGSKVVEILAWRGNDTVESAGQVARLARKWQPARIKVDNIGYGAGTLNTLQHQGLPAVGINVGEAAWDSEQYYNRRTEIFFGLAERFKTGDISLPPDDYLAAQLTSLTFSYTARGQLRLVSKDDMKKQRAGNYSWTSPDHADALSLCFAQEVGGYVPLAITGEERPAGGFRWKT